jgi:predicted O-linked N-acetylglucosamine transferase (SPINDLY family)
LFNLAGVSEEPGETARLYAFAQMLDGDPRSCAPRTVAQLRDCDWNGLDPLIAAAEAAVRSNVGRPTAPFQFLQISADAQLQRRCSERWTAERVLPRASPWLGQTERGAKAPRSERLRIGYMSGDLRDHAMGRLLAGFLPCHDRERFQIIAYSTGPDDGSGVRTRIASSVDRFTDVRTLDDGDFADRIRQDGIDVLVDLGGYTQHSRTEVLAQRPAPVQVSYLGYPGTLGADFVDGTIADPVVVPDRQRQYYTEPIVHLRSSMLATPAWESGEAQAGPARSLLGLPHEAIVLACFAAPLKWRPDVFDAWLRVLEACPVAVLWLLDPGADARSRLIERARAQGVDADRLVWAPRVAYEEHSRRLPAADLCLDTYPYGSGATAVQTLCAGVPLLALTGCTFVSRMAASLLDACALPGLITASLEEYEAQARRLLADPAALPALRKALRTAIPTVFDGRAHAAALEECFTTMVRARS